MSFAKCLSLGFLVVFTIALCLHLCVRRAGEVNAGSPRPPASASLSSGREYLLWANDRAPLVELSPTAKPGPGPGPLSSAAVLAEPPGPCLQIESSLAFAGCQANDLSTLASNANFSCVPEPGPMGYLLGFMALIAGGIAWRTLRSRFAIAAP